MEATGNYITQNAVSTAETIPDIAKIQQGLNALYANLGELTGNLYKIANELFGSPAPSAVPESIEHKSQGTIEQIHGQIDALHFRAQEMQEVIRRFSRLL